jgi:hypothetical protein
MIAGSVLELLQIASLSGAPHSAQQVAASTACTIPIRLQISGGALLKHLANDYPERLWQKCRSGSARAH